MSARLRWVAGQFSRPRGWAGRLFIGPWLDRIGAGMNRLTFARLEVQPGDSVLEVGFGGGGLLAMILAATEGEVTGVDLSAAMAARARRRFAKVRRLRLEVGSVDALPLADASVDLLLCTEVIAHLRVALLHVLRRRLPSAGSR